jgi:hypothetical protein
VTSLPRRSRRLFVPPRAGWAPNRPALGASRRDLFKHESLSPSRASSRTTSPTSISQQEDRDGLSQNRCGPLHPRGLQGRRGPGEELRHDEGEFRHRGGRTKARSCAGPMQQQKSRVRRRSRDHGPPADLPAWNRRPRRRTHTCAVTLASSIMRNEISGRASNQLTSCSPLARKPCSNA